MCVEACGVCHVSVNIKPSRRARTKGLITCSRQCRGKLCETVYKGIGNPNRRHAVDVSFMDKIDSEEKAYLLGWIGSDGHVADGTIVIEVHDKDVVCMERLAKIAGVSVNFRADRAIVRISSMDWVKAVREHLAIAPGKKSHSIRMPVGLSKKLELAFIRGYFDGDGSIGSIEASMRRSRFPSPRASIASNSAEMLGDIKRVIGSGFVSGAAIAWSGSDALDFLAQIYDDAEIYLVRKRDRYLDWANWTPGLGGSGSTGELDGFIWCKSRKDAVPPQKARASDSGYDLVLLERVKEFGGIELFDTGIKVRPPFGYYFDLIPRGSIIKSGYMLANSVGVIDQAYTGSILVPLIRLAEGGGMPGPLKLPNRLVQIVPRKIVHFQPVEVAELSDTTRGSGRFGSTGA